MKLKHRIKPAWDDSNIFSLTYINFILVELHHTRAQEIISSCYLLKIAFFEKIDEWIMNIPNPNLHSEVFFPIYYYQFLFLYFWASGSLTPRIGKQALLSMHAQLTLKGRRPVLAADTRAFN